jgi:hypothetical protein
MLSIDPFAILDASYQLYPASTVEMSRDISVGYRPGLDWRAEPEYDIRIRLEIANRESLCVMRKYTRLELSMMHDELRNQMIGRDIAHMFRKLEANVNALMDRTNKEPWT